MAARLITFLVVLFLCVVFSTLEKSSNKKCAVCEKKIKNEDKNYRKISGYVTFLYNCFGITYDRHSNGIELICNPCRRAVQQYKRTGKTFHHVSKSLINTSDTKLRFLYSVCVPVRSLFKFV